MSKKIVELALENAKLNNEIANSVTGGDSYCHLMVSVSSNSIAEFVVLTRGKYPVYDVEIQIHDLEEKTRLLMERVEKGQISNSFIESMQLMNIASKTKKLGIFIQMFPFLSAQFNYQLMLTKRPLTLEYSQEMGLSFKACSFER